MTDALRITIKFKKQRKFFHLCDLGILNKNTILIKFLFQNVCSEPFRNKGNF